MKINQMKQLLVLIFFIFLYQSKIFAASGSYTIPIDTTIAQDTSKSKLSNKQIFEKKLGRKLTIGEQIELFIFGKRTFFYLLPQEEKERIANNTASFSFWFALFSIINPALILLAIGTRNLKGVDEKYLTDTSKRRLKFVDFMTKFWLILFGVLIVLFIIAAIIFVGWFFADFFKGLH